MTNLSLVAHRIFESHFALVATPSYLEKRGIPQNLAELNQHDGVIFGKSCTNAQWELAKTGSLRPVPIRGRLAANHLSAVLEAVREGFGIGLLPLVTVKAPLEKGLLVEVLPKIRKPSTSVSIVWIGGKFLPPAVRALVDYTKEIFPHMAAEGDANG